MSNNSNAPQNGRARRLGDFRAVLHLMEPLDAAGAADPVLRKRRLVADLCRLVGNGLGRPGPQAPGLSLAPRMRQTLECLLQGDSEKQAAARLGISPHTLHVYVKSLYKHYDVSSRAELLARFLVANLTT